jgi:murein DD-endopeptidase MepM/ murein hydrolase activator NlpD
MKTELNKILYKLAESELNNSVIDEQSGKVWQRIKDKFKRKTADTDIGDNDTTNDDLLNVTDDEFDDSQLVNLYFFAIDPPMVNASINSKYNELRGVKLHKGIDMRTNPGTTVYTVRPGTVVDTGNQPTGWGNFVVIKHDPMINPTSGVKIGETFYSVYAHLLDISVSKGESVKFKTIVGKSGGSKGTPGAGNSRGPHLHFEIKTARKGSTIDPVAFYAKYKQKLEHAQLHTSDYDDTNIDKSIEADYIVDPSSSKAVIATNTAELIKSDAPDKIIPGTTELDGFFVYELPNDNIYLYGVPTPRSNSTYGWWFVNSTESALAWNFLKSRLTPANYNSAITKLNNAYPSAIDQNKLATTEIPQPRRNNNTTNKPKTEPAESIFDNLVPGHIYTSQSVLKSKSKYKLYRLDNSKKKLVYVADATIDTNDTIKYIGHDKANRYMHVLIISAGEEPDNKNKYWISVNDIDLKQ